MKVWTVQRRSVVNYALKNGAYYPILEESDFVREKKEIGELYRFMRDTYCSVNRIECSGLIFGFMVLTDNGICYFDRYSDFEELIRSKKECLYSLWNHFLKDDHVVVELEITKELNLLPIDLNDFQFLMPPVMLLPPYTKDDFHRLLNNLRNGIMTPSKVPSDVVQVHLPFMTKEDISGIYPMFEI